MGSTMLKKLRPYKGSTTTQNQIMPPICHLNAKHRHLAKHMQKTVKPSCHKHAWEHQVCTHINIRITTIIDTPGKPWANSASGTKHMRSFRVVQLNQPQTQQLRVHAKKRGKRTVVRHVPGHRPGPRQRPAERSDRSLQGAGRVGRQ